MDMYTESAAITTSLLGGALMGLSMALMLLFNGRSIESSKILHLVFRRNSGPIAWAIFFLLGLLSSGPLLSLIFYEEMKVHSIRSTLDILLAGLFVGLGSSLIQDFTPRFRGRSLVGLAAFFAGGLLTQNLLRWAGWWTL